ncbi:hypothetical protein BDW72DRAFT_212172 [Aspergillus terricola var. indicus]
MSWTQISHTRWETPLSGMEDYFAFTGNIPRTVGDERYQFVITSRFKVDIDLPNVETALKQAWIKLRFEHPQIAATTRRWKETADADELLQTVTSIRQTTLYYVPRSDELVLRCHHHISDGIGSLQPTMLTPEQAEQGAARLMAYLNKLPAIGPVCKVGKVPPGQPKTMDATFSSELTAAVHAAYAQILQKYPNPELELSWYTAITAHNMRWYLAQNPDQPVVSLYYACQFVSIPLPASYSKLAQTLNHHYETTVNDEALKVHDAFTRTLSAVVRTPEYQNTPIPADATTSSLGIVEKYLQREYGSTVKVNDFRMGCEIILGMTTLHFWTFRNQMHLAYSSMMRMRSQPMLGLT